MKNYKISIFIGFLYTIFFNSLSQNFLHKQIPFFSLNEQLNKNKEKKWIVQSKNIFSSKVEYVCNHNIKFNRHIEMVMDCNTAIKADYEVACISYRMNYTNFDNKNIYILLRICQNFSLHKFRSGRQYGLVYFYKEKIILQASEVFIYLFSI